MMPHAAARLAWSQEAIAVALTAVTLLLVALADAGWDRAVLPFVLLVYSTVGLLVAARHPRNPIAWILCWVGLVGSFGLSAHHYAYYWLTRSPVLLPGVEVAPKLALIAPPIAFLPLLTFGFLLFPDGKLPSRGWLPVAWLAAGATVMLTLTLAFTPASMWPDVPSVRNPSGIEAALGMHFDAAGTSNFISALVCVLASLGSMFVRLRRAQGEERQQLKWVTFAAFLVGVWTVAFGLLSLFAEIDAGESLHAIVLAALPISFGIAIFKYRLYGIDRVILKTIVFGTLAAFITTVYVAVVVGLGAAIGTRGQVHLVLSVLATGFVAVIFQPVRERIEGVANRLVYGRRANPYEVLATFSRRMGEPVATENLLPQMARTLAEGTGATQAAVWLALGNDVRRAAAWPAQPGEVQPLRLVDGDLPPSTDPTRTVPVRHQGQLLGALTVTKPSGEPLTPAEDKLLTDLAAQAGLALRNVGLIEELKASRQRIVAAQDAERRRLERDIHDGAQQRLVTLSLALRMARSRPGLTPRLAAALETAARKLNDGLVELRELARGIHPAILTEEGLGPALVSLAERSAIVTTVASVPKNRLPAAVEATGYQVASHALTAATHAGASSANIIADHTAGRLIVEVTDDGTWPTVPVWLTSLPGLNDRVAALDGQLNVEARSDRGTVVRAVIPCESY